MIAKRKVTTTLSVILRTPNGSEETEIYVEGTYRPGSSATRYDPPEYPEVEDIRAYRYEDGLGMVDVKLDPPELEDAVVALIAEAERGW